MNCMNELSLHLVRGRLLWSLLALFLTINAAFAGIIVNTSPGTAAPPPTLGGYTMFKFVDDTRPFSGLASIVTDVNASNDCPVGISFAPAMGHREVPAGGWNNWSHGYTGDVYMTSILAATRTITLPANTRAFYFYAEGNLFNTVSISAVANDGTSSGPIPVTTPNGAQYYGFYTTGNNCMLTTITISVSGTSFGYAIGEFGINIDHNNGALSCNNNIQISLDQNCWATVTPEMVLSGNYSPGCLGDFQVVVKDWNTNAVIDLDPNTPYPQIGAAQIGKKLRVSVIDPYTGNSCWGSANVEDKLAPIIDCVPELRVKCVESTDPSNLGVPLVSEACGIYTLTYKDVVKKGTCESGIDRIITRTWTAVDAQGNKSVCVQTITVFNGDIDDIAPPANYTSLPGDEPMLSCDAKRDPNFNLAAHLKPAPDCVDDYLLDQKIYNNTGRRVPHLLGWNCIESGPFTGHPSPDGIYYPAHTSCWADNEILMWHGTGAPSAAGCGNIAITFKDIRIDLAKPGCKAGPVGCYKLLRTWTMLDWCSGKVRELNQIIKVMDSKGPEVLYPDHVDVNTDIWKCEGRWEVPPAWVKDNCSEEIHYTVRVENGTVLGNENSGYVVVNLPLGIQNAYIVAEDCCGNVTEKLIELNVEDRTPPVAVCDQKTTVTITGNSNPNSNYAKVFATTFDDGSHDNCAQHLYFKVIRMDELDGTNNGSTKESLVCNKVNGDDDQSVTGSQTYFDDHVSFCCADAGTTKMVVFRVFDVDPGVGPVTPSRMNNGGDLFGRFNDCMVEVEVQDKAVPSIIPPADVVVSCMFWFDLNELTNPNNSVFGRIVTDLTQRAKVKTTDIVCDQWCYANRITAYPGTASAVGQLACNHYNSLFSSAHPDRKYELAWGFDGYILSTCGVSPTITVEDKRECGQGRIERIFSVNGPNNTIITARQTIWVVDCDPLYINRQDVCDPNDDISWPDCHGVGTIVEGCGANTDPDRTGRPRIENGADDACTLIAIQNFDEVFNIEQDACYKILRKWVVIDWCQYDPNIDPNNGRWEFTQVIKVRDTKKPEVTCHVGPCEPATLSNQLGRCVGHISLTATATDSCTQTDWLRYDYKIDAYNDGTIDFSVGALTQRQFAAGEKPTVRNNPNADDVNNPFNASGVYPLGIHKITWYVEDGCGNIGTCSSLFEVKDCKAPTPYCLTGIITVPMPTSGCVDIWAKDLDFASFDNCTPKNRLKFYFDGDPTKTFRRVCCEDFVKNQANDELRITVQMWVEDEEGNKDYCVTTIIVQDNQNICPNTGNVGSVTGELRTEDGRKSANTSVDIFKAGQMVDSKITIADGRYTFKELEMSAEHMIKSTRNDNAANGVSTADIVAIQKHVLGKESLNSPFKLIAADVNGSSSITSADIASIRKLILGVTSDFGNTPSWKFIPEDVVFADKTQPWTYSTEQKMVVAGPLATYNFTAVKIGDVNNSSAASATSTKSRTNSVLNFEVAEQNIEAGQEVKVEFKASNFENISGFQFTLNFDAASLSFDRVQEGVLNIGTENFGLSYIKKGKLTTSWDAKSVMTANANQVLFTLVFKSNKSIKLSNAMEITSDITAAEAYDAQLNESGVNLNVRSDKGIAATSVFELYQNNPNPFDKATTINYRLPEASAATLTIYDVTGKVVRVMPLKGQKGLNTVTINRSEISGAGMFYYQLDANQFSATRKMVITE